MAELNFPPSLKDKSLASSSTSAFDVFISCHGRDVRNTLASPLYRRLLAHGLRVFLDIEEFQLGHTITSQFEIAIQTASVYVAIFSRTYAQSPGCLDEVVMMLQSRKTILPIFYDVSPSELRILKMKKTFDSETIKEISRYDSDTLGKWRKALDDVANITGFELEAFNGDKEQLVKQVVERVSEIVKKPLYVAEYPTGLDEKVKDIERAVLEQQHRLEAIVIGIVGLGGVGKTTLAKEFFNRQRSNYERCCFLGDVRLNAARGSLNSLQGKLLKDLAQLNKPISTIYEGIEKLQKHLYYSHALIILDDVDCLDQLQALLLPANVLRSGSLILVTSRDKNVLNSSGIGDLFIYKLEVLNPQHSTELFCSYAFNQPHPVAGFEQVVNEFVYASGGLPLSLQVFGALLHNQNNLDYWKAQLRKISKLLPSDIQNSLKISYDSLHEEEKQIFLDIACFFIGEDMDTAIRIWDGSGWAGRLDLRNLEAKCIVEIDSKNRIRMHNHFRDLGRCIAEEESLGRPVRLWCPTEDFYKLYNLSDHSPIRGVNIVERRSGQSFESPVKLGNRMLGMTSLQLLRVEGDCNLESIFKQSHLLWLCWYGCPYPCLPSWIPMKSLRVLQVEGNILETLWEDHDFQAPLQLRELNIDASLSRIPKSIGKLKHLEKFVLHLNEYRHAVDLKTLPEEFCYLQSLRHLELKKCSKLKSLPPSFGMLTDLKHFDLSGCSNLLMLPESLGKLQGLQYFNLSGCSNLKRLPDSFGNLMGLQHIDISRCSNLEMLPDSFGELTNLQHINLSQCSNLRKLPNSLRNLKNLRHIDLSKYPNLDSLPYSFGNLRNLQHINLSECSNLQMLPNSLENLKNLKHIDLSRCSKLQILPNFFGNLRNLQHIDLSWCSNLLMLPNSFGYLTNLQHVDLSWCSSLTTLPKSFGNLIQLKHLCLRKCYDLTISSETLGKIRTLEWIEISGCCGIEVLPPQVAHQRFLREMYLFCPFLKELPGAMGELSNLVILHLSSSCLELLEIKALVSLEELRTRECVKLKCIQGLAQLTKLRRLEVTNCSELELLEIETLVSLEELTAIECVKLKRIQGLVQLTKLWRLDVSNCSELELLKTESLVSLEELRARGCVKLKSIQGLAELTKLRRLDVSHCSELELLETEALVSLEELRARGCVKLKSIQGLAQLTKLRRLDVSDCSELELLETEALVSLEELRARGCVKLESIQGLAQLTKLQRLDVSDCFDLELLETESLVSLEELTARGCVKLKSIQGLAQLTKLWRLDVSNCSELELLETESLVSLEKLRARGCVKLKSIQGLAKLTKLRRLDVSNCSELELLETETLVSLEELSTCECVKLKRIQGLLQLTKLRILDVAYCSELEELEGVEHMMWLELLDLSRCPKLVCIIDEKQL